MPEKNKNERWFTVKGLCDECGVTPMSFTRFKSEVTINTTFIRYEMRGLRGNVKTALYSEEVLKEFQAWLMKNQATQGRSSEFVKSATAEAVKQDLAITTIIQSGNVEAMKCLMNHYVTETQAIAEVQAQKRLIETLQPKAEVYDKIANSNGLEPVEIVGQNLGFGKIKFFERLRDEGIFKYVKDGYGNQVNSVVQYYLDEGWFEMKSKTYPYGDEERVYTRIFVTPKGKVGLVKKLKAI